MQVELHTYINALLAVHIKYVNICECFLLTADAPKPPEIFARLIVRFNSLVRLFVCLCVDM